MERESEGLSSAQHAKNLNERLLEPILLSSRQPYQGRILGRNAFLICTPREIFSFCRRDFLQHYLGAIYKKAHTSSPQRQAPADIETTRPGTASRTFSPSKQVRKHSHPSHSVPSDRSMVEVAFSPFIYSPGKPASPMEFQLGEILRECDEDAIKTMLTLAESYPVSTKDNNKKQFFNSVRSLQTLAKERNKSSNAARNILDDELRQLCKKRLADLSSRRDWMGERTLREYRNSTQQIHIQHPHRTIRPVSGGPESYVDRLRRRANNTKELQEVLVSPLNHKSPIYRKPRMEPIVVEGDVDSNQDSMCLLTLSQILDVTETEKERKQVNYSSKEIFGNSMMQMQHVLNEYESLKAVPDGIAVSLHSVFDGGTITALCDMLKEGKISVTNESSDKLLRPKSVYGIRAEPLSVSNRPKSAVHRSSNKISTFDCTEISVSNKNTFKQSAFQRGGNGVIYRDDPAVSPRRVVQPNTPVKFWNS
jgi:hypothetical protein